LALCLYKRLSEKEGGLDTAGNAPTVCQLFEGE